METQSVYGDEEQLGPVEEEQQAPAPGDLGADDLPPDMPNGPPEPAPEGSPGIGNRTSPRDLAAEVGHAGTPTSGTADTTTLGGGAYEAASPRPNSPTPAAAGGPATFNPMDALMSPAAQSVSMRAPYLPSAAPTFSRGGGLFEGGEGLAGADSGLAPDQLSALLQIILGQSNG